MLLASISIASCSNNSGSYHKSDCKDCLSSKEIERLEALGASGVGDAYLVISGHIIATDRTDLGDEGTWENKALKSGSTIQNLTYAGNLLDESRKLDKDSPSRKVLLEEARKRCQIALANAFILVSYDDNSIRARRELLETADKTLKDIELELRN